MVKRGRDIARPPQRKPRKSSKVKWKLFSGIITLGLIGTVVLGSALAFAVSVTQIPLPKEVARAQTTIVMWADGEKEIGRFGEFNRTDIELIEVPQHVQQAVLAAEDRNFYNHRGFSIQGFTRALLSNIFSGTRVGGSTITQQYAKLAFLTQEKSLIRKAKELVLAIKLESVESKEEILENYLNTAYFGRGAYGIQAAARTYFGLDAAQLSIPQGAALAALLQAPSATEKIENRDRWINRFNYVLNGMVDIGAINASQKETITFPESITYTSQNKFGGTNGYLLYSVRQEMLEKGYTEDDLNLRGLKVISTFEENAQTAIVDAVTNEAPTTKTEGLRIGIASVRPGTGEVVAIYGGPDYVTEPLNNATQAIAQAGSTFKPFALAAAFEQGIALDTVWNGNSPRTFGDYTLNNYSKKSFGDITLLQATENSVNTVYVDVAFQIGKEKVFDATLRAGIPAETAGMIDDITLVLGTASPHVLDVANAYATFAARGIYAKPTMIKEIYGANDGLLYQISPETKRAFTTQIADEVTYALSQVIQNGTGTRAKAIGRPAAGKTGTTDGNKSAWFAGYTPQLATAVMMVKQNEKGDPISLAGTGGLKSVTGGSFPALMWTYFMKEASKDLPKLDFPPPPGVLPINTAPPISNPEDETIPEIIVVPTPTPTPTPIPTITITVTPTPTPAPTPTPTVTITVTPTPTETSSATPSPTS
ncbi:MAG: transglycosylase domain-containing protein [Candidatus Nanopelagicales bacterium]